MDAQVARRLGEWQSEYQWLLKWLPVQCELMWSRREHLEAMVDPSQRHRVDLTAWAPWTTLADLVRWLRAHGCTGENSPKLFRYGSRNPRLEWQEVLSASHQGQMIRIIQSYVPQAHYYSQLLSGDGRLWLVVGDEYDYQKHVLGELITTNVLAEPDQLVRSQGKLMSLDRFITTALSLN